MGMFELLGILYLIFLVAFVGDTVRDKSEKGKDKKK